MGKQSKKKRFTVEEGESINDCLNRMKKEGYLPVRRMEEPVLKEVKKNGKIEVEVARQQIVFEGKREET
ncbi:DNA-binding PadR family transcriptional regulator [Evansella vedderi]|uniref:DNA-binding PadR family transcriptional regulator n=1 Tax=Evansella vedderi TaxID=38282 RepID=A0ABT9ZUE5_9BACI|nr:NETI motif-containing protein [Evansella vedderi]MDQ0254078.1 DNA-binding PadR family transcriptional regulator [Evansella vedderi]